MLAACWSVRCSWRMLSAACMHSLAGKRSLQVKAILECDPRPACCWSAQVTSAAEASLHETACPQPLLHALCHSVRPATPHLGPCRTPAALWRHRFCSLLHAMAAVLRAASFPQNSSAQAMLVHLHCSLLRPPVLLDRHVGHIRRLLIEQPDRVSPPAFSIHL